MYTGNLARNRGKESFVREIMCRYIVNHRTYMRKQLTLINYQWQTYYINQLLLYYTHWCCIEWNSVTLNGETFFLVIIILVHFRKLLILKGISTKIRYFSDLKVKKLWIQGWSFSRQERVYGAPARSKEKESFVGEIMCRFIVNHVMYIEKQMLLLNNQ